MSPDAGDAKSSFCTLLLLDGGAPDLAPKWITLKKALLGFPPVAVKKELRKWRRYANSFVHHYNVIGVGHEFLKTCPMMHYQ